MDQRARAVDRILERSDQLFRCLHAGQTQAWFDIDLTMPQLKVLMCVAQHDNATSGQVARALGVSLPTVTGLVDRLVEHDFVVRREDPLDRRVTRVVPTSRGEALVQALLRFRREAMSSLLARLSSEQLVTVETAFDYLASIAEPARQEVA
jgi:DNA-binding MarR family transcriptional regulator